jgi:hypothetical protein
MPVIPIIQLAILLSGLLFLFAIGTRVVCLSAHEWSVLFCLQQYGAIVDAEITELREFHGRGIAYEATYRFNIHGVVYGRRQQISRRNFKQISIGDLIKVTYYPNRPAVSRIGDNNITDNTSRNGISYAAFAAFIAFPPFIVLWIAAFFVSRLFLYSKTSGEK